ncbi:MAG: DUF309 domain-containing protein [Candidatus Hydrogenedentes bacterium]|nr:DUF309 domain-containing protein [Candidatus Hydrogenedentota bacterium]
MVDSSANRVIPLRSDMPQYCPGRPRPGYAYRRGLNPHPTRNPGGHSYGHTPPPVTALPPGNWRENEDYLYGIDLYHEGYLWESHEAWEGLWKTCPGGSVQAAFYRALILNSAAQIKLREHNLAGARRLSGNAFAYLKEVAAASSTFMGLDLQTLSQQFETYYGPLWRLQDPPEGYPPRFGLQIRPVS